MRRKIRLGILMLMAVVLSGVTAFGQGLENYRFETGTDGILYADDVTFDEIIASGQDDAVSAVTDIGFTFVYDGSEYTHFSVNSNGRMRLGDTQISTAYNNPFSSSTYSANTPAIVAVGRDCSTGAAGYVKTGLYTSGSMNVRVIECLLNTASSTTGTNYIKFQIQLYKGTNEVRIVYDGDNMTAPTAYQIGLGNADASKFWYVNPSDHTATYSTTYTSSTYGVHPGANRYYSFVERTTAPYFCDFESAAENEKWTFANVNYTNRWIVGNGAYASGSTSLYVSNDGSSYAYSASSQSYVYAYRSFYFASAGDYVVSFKWKARGESGCWDAMYAALVPPGTVCPPANSISGSSNTLPTNYINVADVSQSNSTSGAFLWTNAESDWRISTKTVTISETGEYTLVFYWKNDNSGGTNPPAAVDDIEIASPCDGAATLSANVLGATSVEITRTSENGTNYQLLVSASSDLADATETPVVMTSETMTIGGLLPGTQYYAYIRSYCSEYRFGEWGDAVGFVTEDRFFNLPYSEGFENETANDWIMANATNGWYVGTATAKDGDYSMYISNDNGVSNEYDGNTYSYSYAYCKLLVEETGVFNVSFDWKCYGYFDYHMLRAFLVPVSLNPNLNSGQPNGMSNAYNDTPAGWIAVGGDKLNDSEDWVHVSDNLILTETGLYYLVFYWRNDYYSLVYNPPAAVDNISVAFSTSCLPVTDLITTNVGKTSASVTWSPIGDETQWQVSLTTTPNASPDEGNITLVNTTSHTFSGLNYYTYYYAYARAYCSESDQSPWSSAREFLTLESCSSISDLTISGVTSNAVTLSWTNTDADASQWEVKIYNDADNLITLVDNTTPTITGLTPNAWYYVEVRCDCGEFGYSDYSSRTEFLTSPEPVTLPYSEDFESGMSSHWAVYNDDNGWYVGRATNNGGTRALYISDSDGASNSYNTGTNSMSYAYFFFEIEERSVLNVSYDWKSDGEDSYDYARAFIVPASLDPLFASGEDNGIGYNGAPNDWIAIDDGQMTNSSSWSRTSKNVVVDAGNYYLVFYWTNDGSVGTQPPAAIDNLNVSVVSTCIYSTNVSVSNVGKTTAHASWEGGSGSVSQYEMLVTTASNPDEATETPISVNTDSYDLTGLDPDTHYYLYVRGVCSESSKGVWYQDDFTTLPSCIPLNGVNFGVITKTTIEMFLLNEDPDASQWEVLMTTASNLPDATESSVIVDNLNPTFEGLTSGTQYSVFARTYCSSTDQSEWISVGTFTTRPACIDVMDVTVDSYGKTWATVSWTNTDSDASQWQVLVTTASTAGNATEEPVLVNTNPATIEDLEMNTLYYVYVRAYCSETAQSEWVSSSSFTTYPPCVPPVNISAVVNSNEANFTWTHDYLKSTHQMYHLYLSEVEMSETELNALTSSEYYSTGIRRYDFGVNGGQTYHLYLRAVCVEGDYSDWTHFQFTTPTDEVMPLPYYQDFETDIVENWHLANGTSNNCWFFGAAVGKDSDKSLYVTSLSYSDVGWATVSGTSYVYAYCRLHVDQPCVINVSFDWNCQGSSNGAGALRAFMIPSSVGPHIYGGTNVSNANGMNGTSTATPDGWIDVSEGVSNGLMWGTNSWVRNSKNLILSEPDDYYFVLFNRTYSAGRPAAVDNLSIEVVSTCIYPQNVSLDSYDKTSATLSWENVVDESQWQVLATTANSPEEATETPVLVDNLNPTIEGLTPGTQYTIYVRTYCSSTNHSEWVSAGSFTTLPACIPVQHVQLVDYGKTSVTISWTNVDDDASQWQVLATTASTPEEATETPILVDATTATVTNLEMNTRYYVFVRSYCSESSQSEWSSRVSFTTLPPCEPVYDVNAVVTQTSAKIRWQHPYGRTNYFTIFSETAMTPEELAVASHQTTSDKYWNLNDLTPGTTYHEYIAADCGDGDVSEWVDFVFTTPEQEAMPLPYSEDFEDGYMQNWIVSNQVNGWSLGSAVASVVPSESTMSMYVSPDEGLTYQYNTYYSVSYAYCRLNIDHPSLINVSYDWTGDGHGVGANMRTFLIPTSLNPNLTYGTLNGVTSIANTVNTPSGWIELGTPYPVQCSFFNRGADNSWLRSSKDVTIAEAGDYYLVYFWGNNANLETTRSAAVDNISVTHVSDCIFAGNISVDEVRREEASVSWTYLDGSQWEVLVSRSNDAASATETPVLVSSPSYTAQNLSANTTYYVYVRTYCSESEQSPWSNGVSFKTVPPCETVSIVSAQITHDKVAVTWSQPYSYNQFYVYLSQTEMSDAELNASSYEIVDYTYYYTDGLMPNQGYHLYISSVCSSFDNSEWYDYYFETPDEYFTIPYHEDFESNVIYGWDLNSDGYNVWTIGSATSTNGSQSMYIAEAGHDDNEYDNSSTTYAYAYCPIYIDRAGLIRISFDWKANGEDRYDFMRAFLAPSGITLSGNIGIDYDASDANTLPAGCISVEGGTNFMGVSNWQHASNSIRVEPGVYNLVYFWHNDYAVGDNPPGAVDDITIVWLSEENDILSFDFDGAENVQIDNVSHTVTCNVAYSVNLRAVRPVITVSDGATISPASGASVNLNNSVVYTVTAEAGNTQAWTVLVSKAAALADAEILSFWTEGMVEVSIDSDNATVNATISRMYDITSIVPTIEISTYASINQEIGRAYDFSNPVEFVVTAEDGTTTKYWTINVSYYDTPLGVDCSNPYVVDAENDLPYVHTSSTEGMLNMLNTYFSDSPLNQTVLSGNDAVYRIDVDARKMLVVSAQSYSGNFSVFVMNTCGTQYSYMIDSKIDDGNASFTVDCQPGSYYVIIDSNNDDVSYEIQIQELPHCYVVEDLEVSRLQNELGVAWSSDNVGDTWTVKYGLSGFDVETEGTSVNVSAPHYEITGLTESTLYDIYVRANCAGANGNSEWTLISASTIAACQTPEDLVAVEIFDNEATISWNGFNMTQWEIGYKMESETEYTTMIVNENSVNLTNLQYSTSYDVRVRSVCDGDYSGYAEYTFTTVCLIVRTFPYTEDFGSGTFPPLCWTQERTAAGSGMGVSYANGAWTSASAAVGGNSTTKAMLADTKAGSVHNLATSGMIFSENLNGYSISLDVYRSSVSVSSFDEGVEVWVNSSPDIVNGNPQMLGYVSKNYQHSSATVSEESAPGWYTYNFIARNRTGLNYVILVGKSNNAGGVYVDNLVIDKTVDCLAPNSLVLQSSGDDNAVLAWSDDNAITGTWTVRYSIDGGDEVVATVDEPTITINGLLPNTTYQISAQIQSVCAAGMESDLYEASIEVTTGCAILDAPYSENFGSYDGVTPDCWFAASEGNNVWAVSNGMAHIASASIMNNAHLISPRFNLSGDNRYLMSFDVLQSTLNVSRPDSLFVLFIKDGTEIEIDTLRSVAIQNASANGMVQIKVDVPQTNGVGSFDFALNGYRECSIDNFLLRAKSNEAEILTFAIEEQTAEPIIDSENATIAVSVVNELENGMEFAPTFTISENATVDEPSGASRDFSEPVEYVVTAEDGVTIKTWTVTVTIDENYCQNPTANDIALAVAADSVTITIAQVNNETSYDLMVSSVQITPETDTADVFSGNVGAVTVVNGLQYNTNYYVYVRSDCGTTRWTALTFTTSCDVKQLPFSEDFSASTMPECWSIVDANNDNKTWTLTSGEMVYTYSRLREADDYIVSPEISIVHNAKLKFDYHVGNFSYPETFSVYVFAGNDSIRLDSMTVSNESVQTFGPVDLTDFAGQDVRIAIRCQSQRYMYRLYVDNFDISVSNYVLEASAVGRGTITPSGLIEVAPGDSAEFVMTADEYNEFVSLTVDGEDVTDDVVDGAYTLAEVYDEHSIVATFTERYLVVASSGQGGHLEPDGEFVVDAGESKRFFIVPDEGYRFESITVDGDAVALESENLIYSLDSITADHNVYVTFTPILYYTISVTSSENGIVNPNGNISVEEGTSLTLYVLPDEGFMIGDFLVDGVDASADIVNGEYTFENINANHNVNVIFVENVYYTVTATSGEHGTITPEGESQVVNGGSISFEVVPDEGYYVASFTVDGNDAMSGLVNGVYVLDDVTADHEVYVGFEIYTYNIFAYAVGGTISPSGTTTVAYGQSQTYELTPNNEYELSNVFIDNHVVELEGNTYTFENVTASHNIVAVFTPMNITRYTISSSAGEHGSISPSGNVRVVEGDAQTFDIVPDEHYYISSLLVDGESVEVAESYTFENVAANHTIVASFEVYKHIVTATAGENGSVSPAGEIEVNEGDNFELQFLPDEGYWVSEVVVDGDTIATHSNEYVVENVLADMEVVVNFEPLPQWTVTAMAGENGSISPEGVQTVNHGSSIQFVFTPDDGYMIERVVVDGATVAINGNSYTFENVTGDHYIYVSFRTLAYFITTVVGENGRITPSGVVEVQPGESKMFRFVPNVGYEVDSVRVDGMNVMFSNNMYTFNNVTENHVLEVTFRHINVTVDEVASMDVSLYPNPNDGHFSVDFAGISGDVVFQLVDAGGALVDVRDIYVDDGSTMEFSYNLVPGVYFARFISDGRVFVKKFVVE